MANIEQIRGLSEPFRGNLFNVNMNVRGSDGVSGEVLSLRVQTSSIPEVTIEATQVNLGGFNIQYPGRAIPATDWSTTVVEGINLEVHKRLLSWQSKCFSLVDASRAPIDEIKADALVNMLGPNNSVVATYKIIGIWPQSVPSIELDYASGDVTTFDISWAIDVWLPGD